MEDKLEKSTIKLGFKSCNELIGIRKINYLVPSYYLSHLTPEVEWFGVGFPIFAKSVHILRRFSLTALKQKNS